MVSRGWNSTVKEQKCWLTQLYLMALNKTNSRKHFIANICASDKSMFLKLPCHPNSDQNQSVSIQNQDKKS